MCSTKMIKMQLDECVRDICKEDSSMPLPNALNRCFYPTEKTIYNFMYSAIFHMKKSKYDQEALEEMITVWVKESPEDKFFLRPFKENGENDEDETVDTLLFIFQSKWQQDLMKRYGNNISLLDATYKTTKYSLPLFFVAVKTNAAYCVVATFIVQSEAASKIREALSIISSWNKDWKPQYFMTDYSEAEINAIAEVFPDAAVHLCSFHREQAWTRWLKKGGNIRADDETDIKKLWRDIAKSRTVQDYEACLDVWKKSEVCRENPKAQQYFAREWIPQVHRWVPALQSDDFLWKVETNNGLENQNRVIKRKFLQHCADKTLSGMVRVVHDQFLPDSITKYITANAKMNPKYKSFSSSVPTFLHDRPTNFIKHVWSRYKSAQTEFTKDHIAVLGSGMFTVQSEGDSDSHYIVDIDNANCSCYDFTKWHLPCKHMCAIFIYCPGVSFEDLPSTYRNNPYFVVDVEYSAGVHLLIFTSAVCILSP
jgi:MULE transposase domain/SWIM zinc finger